MEVESTDSAGGSRGGENEESRLMLKLPQWVTEGYLEGTQALFGHMESDIREEVGTGRCSLAFF